MEFMKNYFINMRRKARLTRINQGAVVCKLHTGNCRNIEQHGWMENYHIIQWNDSSLYVDAIHVYIYKILL